MTRKILLTAVEIVKHFGPEPVLDGVTFDVRGKDKIGIVGPNGAGKTTLLRILVGELDADDGKITLSERVRMGYLSQHARCKGGATVVEVALEGAAHILKLRREADQVAQQIAEEGMHGTPLAEKYERLQHALQRHDAYSLERRAAKILQGLGFSPQEFGQQAHQLSGGQQNRLMLARLLLGDPELLILDEPSNHLDIAATEWLEEFLVASSHAILIVSHDRYLLDKVCNRTLELLRGTVDEYKGNFSAYWRQKAERLENQRRTFQRQQDAIARMEDFIRRNQYGQKHAQAQDRQKKLDRIDRVAEPREIRTPRMTLPACTRAGDLVLRVAGASKSFHQSLFRDLSFDVLRGERWGILGANGSGKSTLLKCCLGIEPLDHGTATLGVGVKVGYYDQGLESLPSQALAVDAVRPDHKEFDEPARRDLLARFGITGDMVFEHVATLSGGERSRVALARLAASDANFLALDEPTNHLDLWARDAIERAITEFQGTVLIVSHDRYFLNRVVDHVLVLEAGAYRLMEGNYNDYLQFIESRSVDRDPVDTAESRSTTGTPSATEAKNSRARTTRKRRFPYRKVHDLEREIELCEATIERLHALLIDPAVLRDGDRIKSAKDELQSSQETLDQLWEHWEEANELNG